jgi:5-(carboxyamino)imidazole ribonucleotide synthase
MKLNFKALILGQGQLAWMLQMQARRLGLTTEAISGPNDHNLSADIITFESEFFNASELENKIQNQSQVFPSLECLGLLQDRKYQKASLIEAELETSPFWLADTSEDLQQLLTEQKSFVAKKRMGGYDGFGTFIIKNKSDLRKFLSSYEKTLDQFIFEKKIKFQQERALQVARSYSGDIQFFPMVETVQKDNKCFYVTGPLKTPKTLKNKITKWLNSIDYVGVMGIEFFFANQQYLINEVAPRVHNTGHHTLDSCNVDQFTMHWLCLLSKKLPPVEVRTPQFFMLNLIGQSEKPVKFPTYFDGSLYWYQKSNRKGRKLGHINWLGKNKKSLTTRALKYLKAWKL